VGRKKKRKRFISIIFIWNGIVAITHNGSRLGEVERQPVRGKIAPNPCYLLAR